MKKIFFLFVLAFAVSCDDGDLALEEIDFTSTASVAACNNMPGITLLFKIDSSEALILEIPETLLVNTVTGDTPRMATLGTDSNAYYRGFNTTVTSTYFCSQLPSSDIVVNLEYTANNGTIEVVTTEILDATTSEVSEYKHSIVLKNVVFANDEGQTVTYQELEYGSINTSI